MLVFSAPITPLLCSGFEKKRLMSISLAVFSLSSLACVFVNDFWLLLVLRMLAAFFHPIYVTSALNMAKDCVDNPKEAPKAVAKVFAGVSAGMVLGMPITSYLGGKISFEAAMTFFFVINALTFLATLFFMPKLEKSEKNKITHQLTTLKEPLLWISIIAVVCLNSGIWGFYGYLSEFLHKISKINFTLISEILFYYGASNIIGNIIAGKVLIKNADLTLKLTPFIMILFYIEIFMESNLIRLSVVIFLLGILGGIMNNATHFMISHPFQRAGEFSNGLFISAANIGLSVGTFVCGLFITFWNARFIAIAAILLILTGILSIFIRSKIEMKKAH